MKKVNVGIVGFGFIGPHHLDAIRRTGLAEVVAIATHSDATAREGAEKFGVQKAYGDWRDLIGDSDVDVVDIATPTNLHAPIALAAIQAGKHVIVDKPMALSSTEAAEMLEAAQRAGVVHAVTFNIRYNAMVQQARAMIRADRLGDFRFARGHYLQEWLLNETDVNWRIDPEKAGSLAMVADAGAQWYDMVQRFSPISPGSFIPVTRPHRRAPIAMAISRFRFRISA